MSKKILKIIGILIVLIGLLLISIPYFFKDQIKSKITEDINSKVEAKVSFADVDLSLFKNFPNATVTLNRFVIINKAPFEGDTLVSLGELNLKMSIASLFKGKDEAIKIDGITSKNGLINILFDGNGKGNFDILKKDTVANQSKSKPLSLKIKGYKIENFKFTYFDESSKIKMVIDSLNHEGNGDFSNSKLDLTTQSSAKVSVFMGKINYMNRLAFQLDAVLGIDLEKSKYTFKENKALINQLPLSFDGFIQMRASGQEYDLKFKTPTASFKNFLGVIPSAYASSLENVKTTGDFTVIGYAKGLYSKNTVPKFNISIASNNASFQYPNLPKSVRNIVIDTKINNETGILNDTYIHINQLSFQIDKDIFNAKATIKNVTQNALVDASLNGTINLANLSHAYPIKLKKPLSGILKADVTTKFDMKSVEESQYQNIKNVGTIHLSGFKYADENGKTMNISNALVQFNPSQVNLKQFNATTGKSDISVTGVLDNFYGFVFKKQELKGNFVLSSNQIAVADFMNPAETAKTETTKIEAMKIPSFLNCTLSAKANSVLYDNLTLKDVSGKLIIKDEKVTFENLKTSIFGGTIGINGGVSTKTKIPVFDLKLNLNQVDIAQSFSQLEMLKKIAPIAGIINGKLNSTLQLNGNLDAKALTPDLKTLSGDVLGQLVGTSINANKSTLLTALSGTLKFIDINKLNLNDVKAVLNFQNGKVTVKPFELKYQDIKATIDGTHAFDQTMNYNVKLDVPAKYIAQLAGNLSSKINPADLAKIQNIPLNALISGNFSNPKITTDMKSAVANLTMQFANQQKDKLIKQGGSMLDKLLNTSKKSATDSTKTNSQKENIKEKATDLLNSFFKKK